MSLLRRLSKRQQQKVVWNSVSPFLELPSTETREGRRAYKAAKRQVEAKVNDEAFLRAFEKQHQSFTQFLLTNNLEPYPPLQNFLNRDMGSFFKDEKKK